MSEPISAGDLFCGGGGTSTGLVQACRKLGHELDLIAINHWDVAIETHSQNHPWARHLCASLDGIEPRQQVPSGRLRILVASPECIHFSNARGDRPMSDQSRSSAWLILKWLQELYVDDVLIENVREFETWGPLGKRGRPLKGKKGQIFKAFVSALRAMDYRVEWRVLNAADYGDATSRERLFLIARRGNKKITWPEPTHAPKDKCIGDQKPWRPAKEIIDWSVQGTSIFNRKRPLSKTTLARIMAGMKRYGWPEPFLVVLRNHMDARSVDEPLPTLAASGTHIGLCQPFVLGQHTGSVARDTDKPLPTITTDGAISLIEPFLMSVNHGAGDVRIHDMDKPLPTMTAKGNLALVKPFLVEYRGNHEGREDGINRLPDLDNPLPTQDTSNRFGLVNPFLVKYYGTAKHADVAEPLDTITAKPRFGVVTGDQEIDIRFRMLNPRELAHAMSFPSDYQFTGTKENQVRQIGNAVPVLTAEALCTSLLTT